MDDLLNTALSVFPERLREPVASAARISPKIQEIRLISEKAVYFFTDKGIRFVEKSGSISQSVSKDLLVPFPFELEELTDRAAGYSGFLYENELSEGYITYGKACRVGICSQNNSVVGGKITSVAVRIPYFSEIELPRSQLYELLSFKKGLLIAGSPGSGKTTLLRYIARKLSDGALGEYKKVCVIDERGEFTGDLSCGICTDVISGVKKSIAIMRAVRLMSPQYIICDEIGGVDETESILEGLNCGVMFAASVHAGSTEELIRRKQFRLLFDEFVFDKTVLLSGKNTGCIERILTYGEMADEINGNCRTLPCYEYERNISYFYKEKEAENAL